MTEPPALPQARPSFIFDRAFLTGVEDVTQLVFVRHGEQFYNLSPDAKPGENVDAPLSERGIHQAKLVGERFSTDRVDAVYASPLRRAYDTGEQIARHHRLEPVVIPDLREIEIFRDVPRDRATTEFFGPHVMAGVRDRMMREKKWDVFPFSESSFEFRRRTVNAVEAIIIENPGKRVVIACHGGVINAYIAHVIGVEQDMFFQPAHTSVHVVNAGEGIRALQSLNDVAHLLTPEGNFFSS